MAMFDYNRIMNEDSAESLMQRKPYCLVLENGELVMTGPVSYADVQGFVGRDYFVGDSESDRSVPELYEKIVDVRDPQDVVTAYRGKDGAHVTLNENGQVRVNPDFSIEEKQVKLYEMHAYNQYDSGCKYTMNRESLEAEYQDALNRYGQPEQVIVDEQVVQETATPVVEDVPENPEDDRAPEVDVEDVFGDDTVEEPVSNPVSAGVVLTTDIEQLMEPTDKPKPIIISNVDAHQVFKTKNPNVISIVVHDQGLESGRFSFVCDRSDVTPHRDSSGKPTGWDVNLGSSDRTRKVSIKNGDEYQTEKRTSEEIAVSYENTIKNHKDFKPVYLNGVRKDAMTPVPDSHLMRVTIPFDKADDKKAVIKIDPAQANVLEGGQVCNLKFGSKASPNVSFVQNGQSVTRPMDIMSVVESFNATKTTSKKLGQPTGTKKPDRPLPDIPYVMDDAMGMDSAFSM